MITTAELMWTAGFLEGEGSFHQRYSGVTATQVQRQPLERLQAAFGGSIYCKNRPDKDPIHTWFLASAAAAALMMTIYREMSPRRKVQIQRSLGAWKQQGIRGIISSQQRELISKALRGRPKSLDHRAKLSLAQRARFAAARGTHCPNGHPWSEAYVTKRGEFRCRPCRQERRRKARPARNACYLSSDLPVQA